MAQKIWSEYFQIGNASAEEAIPGAIIHMQTRNGNDEALVGAVNMQLDADSGLYLPTDKDNPLEARVRHLESLIGALNATKETNPDAASATLLALLRGLMATGATESTLGSVKTAAEALAGTVDSGALKTTLTGRREKLVQSSANYTDTVAAGGAENVDFLASSGHLAEVVYLGIFVPQISGATGSNSIVVTVGTSSSFVSDRIINVSATNGGRIDVRGGIAVFGSDANSLSSEAQAALARGIVFSDTVPLRVRYANGTDKDQTGSRHILLVTREWAVTS